MRVIAICSWFDESPQFLAEMVRSLDGVADHLVAVDGCYALWPRSGERFLSPPEQADAITETADEIDLETTLYLPSGPWAGNEVEKRSFCFRLAEKIAEPDDWYLIMDSDEFVQQVSDDWRDKLEDTDAHAAEVTLLARGNETGTSFLRCLFRALPGIRVEHAHYVFVADLNGRPVHLWGNQGLHQLVRPLDLRKDIYLIHRRSLRAPGRNRDATAFYERRDRDGIENIPFF